jgi:hypothetical protein
MGEGGAPCATCGCKGGRGQSSLHLPYFYVRWPCEPPLPPSQCQLEGPGQVPVPCAQTPSFQNGAKSTIVYEVPVLHHFVTVTKNRKTKT